MNYGQIKRAVLKLLNQYSVAGTLVPGSYNNQQDYINRISALVNDASVEIATSARKIPEMLRLSELEAEDLGETLRYRLPEDFYQFVSGDTTITTCAGAVLHTNRFDYQGRKYLLLRKDEAALGEHTITYYRYPRLLRDDPSDSDELDNTVEVHHAIPFYVAAMLAAHDNPFVCSLLNDKYEDKLARMSTGVSAEIHPVSDVYNFTL